MERTRKILDELKKERENFTCFSCGLFHEKLEAQGIWYCPNALCMGCGGAWFRNTLDSYRECNDGSDSYTIDPSEWLDKGIIYNHEHNIERYSFLRHENPKELEKNDQWTHRELKKTIAQIAYREVRKAIQRVQESTEIFISTNWNVCITIDDEIFQGEELKHEG